jgi:ABC-type transport system involved in multi-copper enzyme maturation permease subunit
MLNIIKSDFFKMKKSRAFWICVLMSLVLGLIITVALQQSMNAALNSELVRDAEAMLAMIPDAAGVWVLGLAFSMNLHLIFIAAFTAIFVSMEFSSGTIKNALSRGANRTKIFFSKFLVCSAAALVMLAVFMSTTLISGTMMWGFDPNGIATVSGIVGMISMQTLLAIAFVALFVFITMALRGGGGSIAVCVISVTIMPTILGAINMLAGNAIDLEKYWLGESVTNLATVTPVSADISLGIIVAIVWGIAALYAGTILFRRADVM